MPNGKPGDHPLTDILIHSRRIYSERADSLVREIADLGGSDQISELLFFEYSDFGNPNIPKLENVLAEMRDRLIQEAKERG